MTTEDLENIYEYIRLHLNATLWGPRDEEDYRRQIESLPIPGCKIRLDSYDRSTETIHLTVEPQVELSYINLSWVVDEDFADESYDTLCEVVNELDSEEH